MCRSIHRQHSVRRAYAAALLAAFVPFAALQAAETAPEVEVTASRLGDGIVGASVTVITAEEIQRSPATTLQDLLARQPGIQVQNLYGQVNGACDVVDMRGFGASASSNTLILVNGRRLNDLDSAGVDFANIPRDALERIEIVRGNAATVLYGNGAVGGAINFVTKTGAKLPSSYAADAAVGSYGYREGNVSVTQRVGAYSVSLYGNYIDSKAYRENNELHQGNVMAEVRHTGEKGDLYLNVSADDQDLGLPGARRVTLSGSLVSGDPRGTGTPFDFADKQGLNLTLGGTRMLGEAWELVLDGGVRHKEQQSGFFSAFGAANDTYTDTRLTTWSLTPRVNWDHALAGASGRAIVGVDLTYARYLSDRMVHEFDPPNHHYDLTQRVVGVYAQERLTVVPGTELSLGARVEHMDLVARDRFDAKAPGVSGGLVAALPYDDRDTPWALHAGLEQRVFEPLTLFGRAGRSMRLPNVEERVGTTGFGIPATFALKTQTSRDVEAGARLKWQGLDLQASGYVMHLENEIHFSSATFTNINLDPTRRHGAEGLASYRVLDELTLRGALAYTRAEFRGGTNRGREVPLVSRWSSSLGAGWDIWGKYAVLDVDWRYLGSRRLDNDQRNFQPRIPGHQLVDLRLGGRVEFLDWSFSVQNLFDKDYFNYGIASATTYGTYNAFPMPGRTYMGRLGVRF